MVSWLLLRIYNFRILLRYVMIEFLDGIGTF